MESNCTRNIAYMGIGKFLANFSMYIYEVGVLIFLYEKTSSLAAVSGFFVSQIVPALFVMIMGGTIDRIDNRRLMVIYNIFKIIALMFILFNKSIPIVLCVTFVLNLIVELESSTSQCLLSKAFSKNQILKISTIINFFDSFSLITAPLISAVIVKILSVNYNIVISATFSVLGLICYIAISFNDLDRKHVDIRNNEQIPLCNKFRFEDISLLPSSIIAPSLSWIGFMFCIGLATPIEIKMIKDVIGKSSVYFGIGNTIEGIGMIIATTILMKIVGGKKPEDVIKIGLLCGAISYVALGMAFNINVYFIGALLVGITATFCPIGFKTAIQLNTNADMIGRQYSKVRLMVVIARILGTLFIGIMSEIISVRVSYFIIAALVSINLVIFMKFDKKVYSKQSGNL